MDSWQAFGVWRGYRTGGCGGRPVTWLNAVSPRSASSPLKSTILQDGCGSEAAANTYGRGRILLAPHSGRGMDALHGSVQPRLRGPAPVAPPTTANKLAVMSDSTLARPGRPLRRGKLETTATVAAESNAPVTSWACPFTSRRATARPTALDSTPSRHRRPRGPRGAWSGESGPASVS